MSSQSCGGRIYVPLILFCGENFFILLIIPLALVGWFTVSNCDVFTREDYNYLGHVNHSNNHSHWSISHRIHCHWYPLSPGYNAASLFVHTALPNYWTPSSDHKRKDNQFKTHPDKISVRVTGAGKGGRYDWLRQGKKATFGENLRTIRVSDRNWLIVSLTANNTCLTVRRWVILQCENRAVTVSTVCCVIFSMFGLIFWLRGQVYFLTLCWTAIP